MTHLGIGTVWLVTSYLIFASSATAGTTTGTLNVSMTIQGSCTIVTPAALSFGNQGVLSGVTEGSGSLSLNCSNGTPYQVGLNAGAGSGATVSTRKLTSSGGATINYVLYRDAGRTQIWGDTVSVDTVSGTGTGSSQAVAVYGRVPAQTTPGPDTYTDAVTITVTY